MSPTMTKAGSLLLTLVLLMWIAASTAVSLPSSSARQAVNPCAGLLDGNLELAVSRAVDDVSDTDSATVEFRAEFGLQLWPIDSVVATTDSVVCTHIDSLINVWLTTAAGVSSGVVKNNFWGPTAVVRLNPGRYYVHPGVREASGWDYNFYVDSVSGSVQFFRGS